MTRVLALLGAILLIAAAVVARSVLDDEGDGDDGGGDGDPLAVACIPELREACEAIDRPMELTVEDPGETIARIAAGDDVDAWVTLDPWPAMAEVMDDGVQFGTTESVASTELVAVLRSDTPPAGCGAPTTWDCLVEQAATVALPEPRSAVGALVLGWAALDWSSAVRPDEPFARAELELPAFLDWLDDIEFARDPLEDALLLGPAGPQVAGTTAVDAARIEGTREEGRLLPTRTATGGTVAIVVAGDNADRIAGEPSFTEALEALGWTVTPDAATTGLPSAGVLVALQDAVG